MADVISLKDKGIPIKIDGATRFVKGATKYTTCSDVIKMVLKKTGIGKEYRHLFAIFEVEKEGERALPGKTRILKTVKEWENEKRKLVLRKVDPIENITGGQSCSSKNDKKKHSKKTEQKFFSKLTNVLKSTHSTEKKKDILPEPCAKKMDKQHEITSDSDSSLEDFISGIDRSKMVEFIKFFNAMTTLENKKQQTRRRARKSSSSSESCSEEEPKKYSQLKACRRSTRRKTCRRMNGRSRPTIDVHPSKRHSVQRLNYGYIDSVKTSGLKFQHDITQIDTPEETCQETSNSKAQRRSFHFKRYFRQNRAKSHNIRTRPNAISHKNMGTSGVQEILFQSLEIKNIIPNIPSDCQELWHENFRRENDSAPASISSDDSLDRDSVLSHFSRNVADTAHNISDDYLSNNKLVDYSITDDEYSDIESEEDALDRNILDVDGGYDTAGTSSSEIGINGECANLQAAMSGCGYHDNQAFNSDSDNEVVLGLRTAREPLGQENNVDVANTYDYIRSIFSSGHGQTEDEEMDSFMKSKIFDESLEEGLSWICSDEEKDVPL